MPTMYICIGTCLKTFLRLKHFSCHNNCILEEIILSRDLTRGGTLRYRDSYFSLRVFKLFKLFYLKDKQFG